MVFNNKESEIQKEDLLKRKTAPTQNKKDPISKLISN
jgi:hypothetical protein